MAFKKKEEDNANSSIISMSQINLNLDEENEIKYTSLGVMVDTEELYEPISLCVVSKFAMFDTLQVHVLQYACVHVCTCCFV